MKRLILATVALSMLAAPAAMAGERYGQRHGNPGWHEVTPKHGGWDAKKPQWKKGKKAAHWKKGQRLSAWERRQAIKEYKRYGLRKPGHGQQWVRVNNDYLLVAMSSGMIALIISGR